MDSDRLKATAAAANTDTGSDSAFLGDKASHTACAALTVDSDDAGNGRKGFPVTTAEIKRGLLQGLPILFGYFPIGFAFGILAASAGISLLETTSMSILVFAGSAQLIAVGLLESQVGVGALVVTTFLVNLRHLLMSAALSPGLGHLSRLQQAFFSFQLTDETFAVHSMDLKKEHILSPPRIFATNMLSHLSWISSSFLGAWAGSFLTDLEAWGLDYALPAMFIALLVLQLENSLRLAIATFSLLLATLLAWQIGGHWYIIIATLLGATTGVALEQLKEKEKKNKEQ